MAWLATCEWRRYDNQAIGEKIIGPHKSLLQGTTEESEQKERQWHRGISTNACKAWEMLTKEATLLGQKETPRKCTGVGRSKHRATREDGEEGTDSGELFSGDYDEHDH